MVYVEQGHLFQPRAGGEELELVPDAVVVLNEAGIVSAFGSRAAVLQQIPDLTLAPNVPNRVILPGAADTHTHTFQPPGIPGVLIENKASGSEAPRFEGWLPTTLRFETEVRNDPERARLLARERFARYIEEGITASLEYTTSSIPALRIVLEEAHRAGLGGRIKAGYVAMDQGVNFINGVDLEVNDSSEQDRVLSQIQELAQEFPNEIVIIDRFPIAVSSAYRRKLIALAQKLGVLYETHADESQGEFEIHCDDRTGYNGRRIISVLNDDGVFGEGMRVGLGHGIHTLAIDFNVIAEAVRRGVEVNVRFCPNSNGNLGSHMWEGAYVPMPLRQWREAGARITLGTDKGAGTGWNGLEHVC